MIATASPLQAHILTSPHPYHIPRVYLPVDATPSSCDSAGNVFSRGPRMYRASRSVLLAIWRSDSKSNHQISFCGRGVLANEHILITVVYTCQKICPRMYFMCALEHTREQSKTETPTRNGENWANEQINLRNGIGKKELGYRNDKQGIKKNWEK